MMETTRKSFSFLVKVYLKKTKMLVLNVTFLNISGEACLTHSQESIQGGRELALKHFLGKTT